MRSAPVRQDLSKLPIQEGDTTGALNREIVPVLKAVRRTLNDTLDGILVELENVPAGTFVVEHGLGRIAFGFQVDWLQVGATVTGHVSIYRRTDDPEDNNSFTLYASEAFDRLRVWVW